MALNANALVSLAAAKSFIAPGGMTAADDQRLEEVINRSSSMIERWCQRPLAKATYTNLRLSAPCGPELFLLHTPIAAAVTISVTLGGTVLTVWRTEADGDPLTFDVVLMSSCHDPIFTPDVLFRSAGWDYYATSALQIPSPYQFPANLLLTYSAGWALTATAGYALIPDDLQEAALELVRKVWTDESKGTQDVTAVTLPSGSFTVFDAAFPRRTLMLLEPYRRMVVA